MNEFSFFMELILVFVIILIGAYKIKSEGLSLK